MIIIGVTALIVWVVSMWKRGGQYTGKMHRWIALGGVVASFVGCMALTNLAIDKRVISNYFGNIAFAYEDYGFPYCFSQVCLIQGSTSRQDMAKRRWRRSTKKKN